MQERLRMAVDLSRTAWAEVLRLTEREYGKVACGKKPLSSLSLLALSEYLDLSLDLMIQNRIDYRAVAERHAGNLEYISDRYTVAAFSKRRTAANFLSYVERVHGWRLRKAALRQFQLTEAAFSDPDGPINIQFLTDLMAYLRKHGLSDADFFAIGSQSLHANRNTVLGQALRPMKTPVQVYEKMILDLISFFERNCTYQLARLDSASCVLESHSNPDVAAALRVKHLGSVDGCLQKAGILSSAPGYIGLPFARVVESTCVHRGDPQCRFEINFELASQRSRRGTPAALH